MKRILMFSLLPYLAVSAAYSDDVKFPLGDTIEVVVWQGGETVCKVDDSHLESEFNNLVENNCRGRSIGESDSKMYFSFNWSISENDFGENVNICVTPFVMQFGKMINAELVGGNKNENVFVEQSIFYSAALHQFDNKYDSVSGIGGLYEFIQDACQ